MYNVMRSGYFQPIFYFPMVLFFLLVSCGGNEDVHVKKNVDDAVLKQALEKVNKFEVQKQTDEINQYVERHNWPMEKTGTGLRYMITYQGKGDSVKTGDFVSVNYKISLLDGTVCYTTENDGEREFKVEQDNVESGLHEAVRLMNVGDKGVFILPSYMANGIQGDNDKIPPMSAIIVELEVLAVK